MFFGGLAFAQSADFVTKIINSDKVTYGQISYLAGVHQGLIDSDFTGDDSVVSHDSWEIANNNGLIPEGVLDTDFVTAENLAYIYAKIWNLGSASLFCKVAS